MKYIIITPAKNEEMVIRHTLNSVCMQTVLPQEWIIVDDGSNDKTFEVVMEYSKKHSWIKPIKIENFQEERSGGAKVVRAFNYGFENLSSKDFDIITKLDADLTLPNNYFEKVISEFKSNDEIGICGGVCGEVVSGEFHEEKTAEYHVRGSIKSYNRECFIQIGGLVPEFGWDGIDEFLAMYYGWKIKVIKDLQVIHHRKTGEETGQFKYSLKMGKFCYKIGYDTILTLLRATKRILATKINFLNGLGILIGYANAIFTEKKLLQENQRKFIKKFQYRRIKNKITAIFHL